MSGQKNIYIYISGEVVDDVFSTMKTTNFRSTISRIDVDSVDRRHTRFPEMAKTFITDNK